MDKTPAEHPKFNYDSLSAAELGDVVDGLLLAHPELVPDPGDEAFLRRTSEIPIVISDEGAHALIDLTDSGRSNGRDTTAKPKASLAGALNAGHNDGPDTTAKPKISLAGALNAGHNEYEGSGRAKRGVVLLLAAGAILILGALALFRPSNNQDLPIVATADRSVESQAIIDDEPVLAPTVIPRSPTIEQALAADPEPATAADDNQEAEAEATTAAEPAEASDPEPATAADDNQEAEAAVATTEQSPPPTPDPEPTLAEAEEPTFEPPTELRSTNQGIDPSGQLFINLAWSVPPGAAFVELERNRTSIITDDISSYRDVGDFTPGQRLTYRIRSLNNNQANPSAWSEPVTITVETPEFGPPADLASTSQGIDPSGQLFINLAWSVPPGAAFVELERGGTSIITDDISSYRDVGDFTPGQQLTYRIRSLNNNQANPSAWSEPVTITVETPEFGIPTNLTVVGQGIDPSGRLFVDLEWSNPSGAAFIEIERDRNAVAIEPGLSYRDIPNPTLTAGQEVTYRIRSLNGSQTIGSAWSEPLTITVETAVLGRPTGLTSTSQGVDADGQLFIGLAWLKPPGITFVQIERDGIPITINANSDYVDVGDFAPGQQVTYRIRSLNNNQTNPSAWSEPVTITVEEPPLEIPTDLIATSQGIDPSGQLFVNLAWSLPSRAVFVEVERDGVSISIDAINDYRDLGDFSPGQQVNYRIRSLNAAQTSTSEWSALLTVTIEEPILAIPTNLISTGQGIDPDGQLFINLAWSLPPGAAFVEIERDGISIAVDPNLAYHDIPLPRPVSGQQVTYRIRSLNAAQTSASEWSALLTVTVF